MAEKKKKSYGKRIGGITALILACLVVLVILMWDTIRGFALKKASIFAAEQVIKQQTGFEIDLDRVLEEMDSEDAETVNEMLEKYVNEENLAEGVDVIKSRDLDTAMDFLEEKVEPEDIKELEDLYEKYKYLF